jgi:hypothetical protein
LYYHDYSHTIILHHSLTVYYILRTCTIICLILKYSYINCIINEKP